MQFENNLSERRSNMSEDLKARKSIIFILMILNNGLAMFPFLGCAVVLVDIMTEVGIPASASAFVISIITIVSGLFMFFGGSLSSALGYVRGFNISILLEVVGTVITAFAPNFPIFMLGRIVFAVGYGLNTSITSALGTIWFPGAQFATFNTVKLISASIGGALAYMVMAPIMGIVGTWRNTYLVFTAILAIYCILCFVFIIYPPGVEEGLKQRKEAIKAGQIPKPEFALTRVLKRKNFIFLTIATLFPMAASSLFQTYLPTYLTVEAGMTAAEAASVSGVGMFAGMAGSLIGGALVAKTGRRKIYVLIACILSLASGVGVIFFGTAGIVLVCYALVNVAFYLKMPAMSQYYREEIVPFDPSTVAPAVAVVNGIPQLLNIIASFVASSMIMTSGYGHTLWIFQILCIISIVASLLLTECGPRAKKAEA